MALMGLGQTCILQNITGLTHFQSWEKRCFPLSKDSTNDRETIFGCLSSVFIMLAVMNTTTRTLQLTFLLLFFFPSHIWKLLMFLKDNMVSDTFYTAVSVTQQAQPQPWPIPLFTNVSETSQCTKHILESILTLTNWDIITFRSKRFSSPVSPSTSHMTHTWKLVTATLTIRISTLKSQVLQLELVWDYVTTLEKKKKGLPTSSLGTWRTLFLNKKIK